TYQSAIAVASVERSARTSSRPKRGRLQNYLVIWADGNIDEAQDDCKKTLANLRNVIHEVNICTTPSQCIDLLNKMDNEKAFVISSGAIGQHLVSDIHDMPQLDVIYIFCGNKARHEQWAKDWPKIEGVYTSITPICESLKKVAHRCDHDFVSMSFIPKTTIEESTSSQQSQDEMSPSYMYSMLFKEIILEIDEDDTKSIKNLLFYCRHHDVPESELINFQKEYSHKTPVEWYSCNMFLFGMINRALWSLDMETMTKTGFFIRNLHRQLEQLNRQQACNFEQKFMVYRGQGFTKQEFECLTKVKGGLLAFNNFLSTSKEKNVATGFVEDKLGKDKQLIGVLFNMAIDLKKISIKDTPFALITEYSAFPEEQEILFSMHTVFRVGEIKQSKQNNRLWEVELTLSDDKDPQLAGLTKTLKEEIQGATGWQRMGKLMLKMSDLDQAEELYNELLKNASTNEDIEHIYHQIGELKVHQGRYRDAVKSFEKCLEIRQKTHPYDNSSLALSCIYNNIGLAYNSLADHSQALEYYNKSHKIKEESLPDNDPQIAISCGNIGAVYIELGDYSKALECFEKTLQIQVQTCPKNHPDIACTYGWLATVYEHTHCYSQALSCHEKALAIFQKSLPSTHPNIDSCKSKISYLKQKM
ncbi:unnamed protein product, partial [Rotaria socialis]